MICCMLLLPAEGGHEGGRGTRIVDLLYAATVGRVGEGGRLTAVITTWLHKPDLDLLLPPYSRQAVAGTHQMVSPCVCTPPPHPRHRCQ